MTPYYLDWENIQVSNNTRSLIEITYQNWLLECGPRCIYEMRLARTMNDYSPSIKIKEIKMVSDVKLRRTFYRVKVRPVRARAIIEALQTLNLPIQLTWHTRSRDIMLFTCSSIKRNLPVLGRIFALPYYFSGGFINASGVHLDNTPITHSLTRFRSFWCLCTYTITIDIIAFTTSWNLYRFPWRFFFVSSLMARSIARFAVNSWPKTVTLNIHWFFRDSRRQQTVIWIWSPPFGLSALKHDPQILLSLLKVSFLYQIFCILLFIPRYYLNRVNRKREREAILRIMLTNWSI